MWTSLLFVCAAVIFLLPLLPALLELRLRQDIQPVAVDQANAGNIDYFAESFLEFISPAIDAYQAGRSQQLIPQAYCLYQQDSDFQPDLIELQKTRTDRVIVGFGDLQLPAGFNFTQEIFSKQNIDCGERARLRSVLATENLRFGRNSQLLRWAHARNISVDSGCLLLGRVSAEAELVLQPYCEFTRLNAQRIVVLPTLGGELIEPVACLTPKVEAAMLREFADHSGRVLLDTDLDFPENAIWQGDLVIRGNALIRRNAHISGSLKVYGDIHIESGVTIGGALVCNQNIHIAKHCRLQGPVVAEQTIAIDSGSRVADAGAPGTVTAPQIRVAAHVVIHGTLWARSRGEALLSLETGTSGKRPRVHQRS